MPVWLKFLHLRQFLGTISGTILGTIIGTTSETILGTIRRKTCCPMALQLILGTILGTVTRSSWGQFQGQVVDNFKVNFGYNINSIFFPKASVNPNGGSCPMALRLIACVLLLEITTFMRESYKSFPKMHRRYHPYIT